MSLKQSAVLGAAWLHTTLVREWAGILLDGEFLPEFPGMHKEQTCTEALQGVERTPANVLVPPQTTVEWQMARAMAAPGKCGGRVPAHP